MSNIVTITVSTKYDDILDIILPQNYKFFKEWFIITDENDIDTINVIKKYNFDNIRILYYDFYKDNCIFNKGGAIKYAQTKLTDKNYLDNLILILDSDIYLLDNFLEIINEIHVNNKTLYGTNNRYDCYSYKNLIYKTPDIRCNFSHYFAGYFQLYKNNSKYLYENSQNAAECDMTFMKLFANKITIKKLDVYHLGKDSIHWNGRKNKDDFIKN